MQHDKETIYCELIVLRYRRGEPGAFEELVRLWESRLFYYVRRLVNEEQDAWDVLQEVWLKTLRGLHTLREPKRLPVWLYRVARNTAISHVRDAASLQALHDEQGELARFNEPHNADNRFDSHDAEQVHHALNQVSLHHREVLTLHFLEDLSLEEIAEVVGIPVGTVKSRLHHAKRALRIILNQ